MDGLKKRDTKRAGDISEVTVMAALIRMGYRVAIPYGENQRYDLIIEDGGRFARVQVKTGRLRLGSIWFNAYSSHAHRQGKARSYAGEIELFGIYCRDVERVFLVPVDDVTRTQGCLRWDCTKNNQGRRIRWAAPYAVPVLPEQLSVGLDPTEGVFPAGA